MIQVPKLGTAIEAENGMNGNSLESEVTSGEEGAVNVQGGQSMFHRIKGCGDGHTAP